MIDPREMYWDSCVFIRYLTRSPAECLADIDRFVEDAKRNERRVYFSTVVFAEIKPRFLDPARGGIADFFADLGRSFIAVEPNPNILIPAGELRDAVPVNPGDPEIEDERKRVIGALDAIHLMTCLYIRDTLEISDIVFHTFDTGKGKTWEGKCVPLLGFERWYPPDQRTDRVREVCGLPRCKPVHPQPDLGV